MTVFLLLLGAFFTIKRFDMHNKEFQIYLGLILAGALSNLFDRAWHGFVIDYVHIWILPIFNLADLFILAGLLLILVKFDTLTKKKKI